MDNSDGLHWQVKNATINIGAFTYGHEVMNLQVYDDGFSLNIGKFCRLAKSVTFMIGGGKSTATEDMASVYPFGLIYKEQFGDGGEIYYPPDHKYGSINIGCDVFIGYETLVMSGVTIGHGAKIGARSLVIHDVPPYTTVGGVPAKVIKKRFSQEIIDVLLEIGWWDLPNEIIRVIAPILQSYPTLEGLYELKEMIKVLKSY